MNETAAIQSQPWHHRPAHIFVPGSLYMVTAGTLHKARLFEGDDRLALLQNALSEVTQAYHWQLQAWAVLANHYHFVGLAPASAEDLRGMIQRLHSQTARAVNRLDGTPGRQVWFQYWDTCLTYEKSYYARLNYVHNNPVHHGLVTSAERYQFCSAGWFATNAEPAFYRKVSSFRYGRVEVPDDF